jgi:nitroreductase
MIDLLRTRRSIRNYSSEPVAGKTVDVLVEALLRSPTSRNSKSWEFVVVDDKELLAKLSKARPQGSHQMQDAALGIVVCADSTRSDVWVEDCSIAAILLQTTAHSMGLGSCWIQIRNRDHAEGMSAERYVQGLLGVPPHIKVECMVSIGYPDETKKPVPENELDYNKVRRNHYSQKYVTKRET